MNEPKRIAEDRAWVRGERSFRSQMIDLEADPGQRQVTLTLAEIADAAAVSAAHCRLKAYEDGLDQEP